MAEPTFKVLHEIKNKKNRQEILLQNLTLQSQNKERPEGYLGSAPLMFVSSRMSPRACRPPSS